MKKLLQKTLVFTLIPLSLPAFTGCGGYNSDLVPMGANYGASTGTYYYGGANTGYGYAADPPPLQTEDNVSYWDGDGLSGSPRITISLSEQKAYFYKGDTLAGVSRISTGREGYNTPAGNFKIIQKNIDHESNLYGDYVDQYGNVVRKDVDVRKDPKPAGAKFDGADMPYFMRIHGGVGMHAGFLPGYPASHGCIRMPEHMARAFYNNVSHGTPVKVTNSPVIQSNPPQRYQPQQRQMRPPQQRRQQGISPAQQPHYGQPNYSARAY